MLSIDSNTATLCNANRLQLSPLEGCSVPLLQLLDRGNEEGQRPARRRRPYSPPHDGGMSWSIFTVAEFDIWFMALTDTEQDEIGTVMGLLAAEVRRWADRSWTG